MSTASGYFSTVAAFAHHGTGPNSKLASQIGFYFTQKSGMVVAAVIVVVVVAALIGAAARAITGRG